MSRAGIVFAPEFRSVAIPGAHTSSGTPLTANSRLLYQGKVTAYLDIARSTCAIALLLELALY